ncbi:MAG: sel1 repeat family protein [Pseudomonadota bacterium]|nr:MAG: sel1 repeat family protein [Pseudomonadota bacterium]
MRKTIAAAVFAAITSSAAWAGPYEDGLAAAAQGDHAQAASMFQKAAQQGLALAQYRLGVMFTDGSGVKQDYAAAAGWLYKAAAQENMPAQHELAILYHEGKGVSQNHAQAAQLWHKAALKGFAAAQYKLAALYSYGQGVQRDYVQAHMWYHLAAIGGQKMACDERDAVATHLTPEQLAESARRARKWLIGDGV